MSDITRVFINMSMMKKFEIPEEFTHSETFIKECMTSSPKSNLEHFKERKPRNRAYTHNDISFNPKVKRNSYQKIKYSQQNHRDKNQYYEEYSNLRNDKNESLKV